MAAITFITSDGERITVEGGAGSVMELAVDNNIKGIEGNCGGVCSCATCHVHVAAADIEKTGRATQDELDLLEFEDSATEFSRLSCQIPVSDALDGVEFHVAE